MMSGSQVLPSPSVIPDMVSAQLQLISQQLNTLTQNVSEVRNLLDAQNEKIDKCMQKVENLQAENGQLQNKVKELEHKINTQANHTYVEVQMRIERERNLIIQGLGECSDNDMKTTVEGIINSISIASDQKVTMSTCYRLGKRSDSKVRAIKVEFHNREDALTVLKHKSKLSPDTFPNIKLKKDRTPLQIQELNDLYKECETRKQLGENVVIRYVNNQPKIITLTTNNKRNRDEEVSPKQHVSKRKNEKPTSRTQELT